MIKLAIKHKILELAIDAFFDKLNGNFMHIAKYSFVKGQHFAMIETDVSLTNIDTGEHYVAHDTYIDCTIIHVGPLNIYTEHRAHTRRIHGPTGIQVDGHGEHRLDRTMIPLGNITTIL